ncbi:TRAP transporter substrate-binding protein DctP [Tropicimonas sp. IMCC34011]|uniref:TRAP transporter substrate-binding protein DctP n=1 Tax=Tropicimonas sp. IMCC34011 TaxID=2248759 RepID=UPI001300214B|nr:TRAP transporter substrate-binding protein DctP [Tropicimonas sp. IMCC34011]
MTHLARLLVCTAAVGILPVSAGAQDAIEMIITNELSRSHWTADQMEQYADAIDEASGGRIDAKVFHSSTLYSDQEAIGALGTGAVHMVWPVSVRLETIAPEAGILTLPFVLDDETMAKPGAPSAVGNFLTNYMDPVGIGVLGVARTADLFFLTKEAPVETMDDLQNRKIRATGGRVMLNLLDEFGASAISMSATEMGPAMSQGAIDGILTSSGGWEMVGTSTAPYGSLVSGLNLVVYAILVDQAWLDGLPDDLGTVVEDATKAFVDENWASAKDLDRTTLEKVIDAGGMFSQVDPEARDAFVEAAETVRQDWSQDYPEAWSEFQSVLEPYR